MMALDRTLLKQRPFLKLLASRTISNFGNGMSPTALAFAVLGLPHGDARDLSVILTAQAIPLVLLLPVGGVFADRIGRARVIGFLDMVLSLVIFFEAALFMTGNATVPALVVIAAITGVLNALWYPAFPGLPTDIVAEEQLQHANSYMSLGSNGAMIVGAAVGGWLVSQFGGATALAVDATTFLIAGATVWTLRHTSVRAKESESFLKELHDGWKVFWSYKWVVVVVAAFSFMLIGIRATEAILGPLVAKQHFDGAISWSQIVAAMSVGLLAGGLAGTRFKPRRPILAGMYATLPCALFQLTLGLIAPLPLIMLAAFLWGMGIELMMIWWYTALQTHIPREALGRVAAYDAFGSLLFGPIGLALAGPLDLAFGARPVLIGCAVLVLLGVGATLLSRDVRTLTAAEPQPA